MVRPVRVTEYVPAGMAGIIKANETPCDARAALGGCAEDGI